MYYKKLFCIFFAVVFLFSTASVAVARYDGTRKFRSNDFDIDISSARPLSRLNSIFVRILESFLPRSSIGLVKSLVEDDESEDEDLPEEEPEGAPDEVPEEESEESPSEGAPDEESVDFDISIVGVEKVFDEEGIHLEKVLVKVSIENMGGSLVYVSLDFEIRASDDEVIEPVVLSDGGSNLEVGSGEEEVVVRDILPSLKGSYGVLKSGEYEVRAICSYMGVEEVSSPCEFEIDEPFDPYAFLSETIDNLASSMYNQLNSNKQTYGVIYDGECLSAIPIFVKLSMLLAAAEKNSETASQIANVLDIEDIEIFLNTVKLLDEDYFYYDGSDCTFNIANKIWFDADLEENIKKSYLSTLEDYFNCDVVFSDRSSRNARQDLAYDINQFVNDNTNDLILGFATGITHGRVGKRQNDFDNIDLSENRNFPYVTSAIEFSGKWATAFTETLNENFYIPSSGPRSNRDYVTVPFMKSAGSFGMIEKDTYKAIELPYEGEEFSMRIIVPKEGYDLSDIPMENLAEIRESLSDPDSRDMVEVSIPKIGLDHIRHRRTEYDLKESLENVGMTDAFSNDANFLNMIQDEIPEFFNLSGMGHSSDIVCDEEGTDIGSAMVFLDVYKPSNENGNERVPRRIPPERIDVVIKGTSIKENELDEDMPVFKANRGYYFEITRKIAKGKYLTIINGDISDAIITPLVLDLDGDGIATSGLSDGVLFDLDADGEKDLTGWTAGSDDAFLCLDLDRNGVIDDGGELFGDNTLLPDGSKALNGFEALAQYDSNSDGKIDKNDRIWPYLRLWCDSNHNGISEKDELIPIMVSRVEKISLDYSYMNRWDNGNLLGECSSFTNRDGSTHNIIDVWFQVIT